MADRWESGVFGIIPRDEWLNVGTTVTRPNDPIDGLFGDEKTSNLVAKWRSLASEYQIPRMAQFHSFDTVAQTTIRETVDVHNIEKGLIKVKLNQSERLRQLIRDGVTADEFTRYILEDGVKLADQVETRTKVAKNELLATGKVTINENGLNTDVDYGVPVAQIGYRLDLGEDADVPGQIQRILDDAAAKGVTITGMVTAKKNLTKMRQNEAMQIAINGKTGSGATVRNSALYDFLESEYGIDTVITNDLFYSSEAVLGADGKPVVTTKRYYPANKVTFFATNPAGKLGVGLWGDPPEVTAGKLDTGASTVSNYITVTQWADNDPAETWTKASALFMPVLYNPNSLWIATIDDDYLSNPTVAPEAQGTTMFETLVSAMQKSDVAVANGKITGTLKYLDTGAIPAVWGNGYFLALKFSDLDPNATSVKIGLDPSVSSGLAEIIDDPDKNAVLKITNKGEQKFVVVSSDGEHMSFAEYDLSGLKFEKEA